MATAVLNGTSHTVAPSAHLQIKYVSRMRLPDTRTSSPFFASLRSRATSDGSPILSSTIVDNVSSQTWRISTNVRNTSSAPQAESIKVYSWPMFEPELSQFVASSSTATTVQPAQSGSIEVEVPKRDLATFNERSGKWVLEQGIYMFEIRGSEDLSAGTGVVKQVSVVSKLEWDE